MGKAKSFRGARCTGEYFRLKTKKGTRCVCAAKTKSGRIIPQFQKDGKCPIGPAKTWKQIMS